MRESWPHNSNFFLQSWQHHFKENFFFLFYLLMVVSNPLNSFHIQLFIQLFRALVFSSSQLCHYIADCSVYDEAPTAPFTLQLSHGRMLKAPPLIPWVYTFLVLLCKCRTYNLILMPLCQVYNVIPRNVGLRNERGCFQHPPSQGPILALAISPKIFRIPSVWAHIK